MYVEYCSRENYNIPTDFQSFLKEIYIEAYITTTKPIRGMPHAKIDMEKFHTKY